MKNNRRYDLSNKLTHFFRCLDLEDGSAPHIPEDWGDGNVTEDTTFTALFLLRCAIRHGRLWATWSLRKEVRTIYGPYPAICFTDMPTAAFLETSAIRLKKKEKISTYALTFPKPQMFGLGARPVIYGLSGPTAGIPSGNGGGPRIMPPNSLPVHEQYRYVTYAPTGNRWAIDWTHEREWRWRMTDESSLKKFEKTIEKIGIVGEVKDIPGLDLYDGQLRGLGVIVNTKEEARKILHDVLSLIDRKIIKPDTYEYVLVADNIPEPEKIRNPDAEASAIAAAAIDLSQYFVFDSLKDTNIEDRTDILLKQVEAGAGKPELGEAGECWLWFVDPTHAVTRALLRRKRLLINRDGKYLLPAPHFNNTRGLRQREEMTKKLGAMFNSAFGVECGYFSVLNSDDPNKLPTYNDDFLDNRLFYNFWSDG
jgi:hypothetical protein